MKTELFLAFNIIKLFLFEYDSNTSHRTSPKLIFFAFVFVFYDHIIGVRKIGVLYLGILEILYFISPCKKIHQ